MKRWIQLISLLLAASAFGYAPDPMRVFKSEAANRLTNTITPLVHSTKLAYNNRGLLQSVTKPSTRSATFGYDARGRQTSPADQVGTTTYQHDANNNLTNVFENGRTNSWTFDAYDRVSSYQDADGNPIQYRRDQNGNVTNLVYPGNRTVSYAYDSLNRLTNVTDWASRQTTLVYDLANRLTSITRPNGTVRLINYDTAGETTNIIEKTTSGFPIAFYQLNYDNAARVQWEFGAPLPQTNAAPPARTMTYDDDNRILTCNGQNVVHDADGNMTTGPLTNNTLVTYGYNARNQLTGVGGLSYDYDPAGNRTSVTSGTNVARFVINPNAKLPQVLMRIRPGATNYYIYGGGLLYEITETATTTKTLTYHYDLRGSTIALTDTNGNVTDRVQYSAYGMITLRGGTNDTPFLHNGRYGVMTEANGLLYMRARYYNPYICRFINPDPAGFAGGLNWYCYADGNPVSQLDPFGLCAAGERGFWSWLGNSINSLFDMSGNGAYGLPSADQLAHAAIDNAVSSLVGPTAPDEVQRPMAYNFGSYDPSSSVPAWADIAVVTGGLMLGLPEDSAGAVPGSLPQGAAETTLYRAVGPAELADIQANNALRNLGSAEGKYFTTSAEAASSYAKQAVNGFGDPAYTIIQTKVPNSIFEGLTPATVDRGIPAWVIPNNRLPGLTPQVLPSMPIPHP